MKPTAETPTPDLDLMLLRHGLPVADAPRIRAIQRHRMYRTQIKVCGMVARFLGRAAAWFEARSGVPATEVPA